MVSQPVSLGPKFRGALHDVLGGGAASVLNITFGLSYALLIFAGPLAPSLSYGVAATFISSTVLATILAVGSSLPFAIGGPESSTAAMTGILASSLVERMALTDPTAPLLAPVLITLGLSTVATGLVLCGFGMTRMGRAIRYVPYPVVGGFLGATSCLIVFGAIRVITGVAFSRCDARPVRKSADAVRTGGGLRHGHRALSDLAPLPKFVWTAGDSDRRHHRRACRVLAGRHLPGGGAGLGLDLSASAACLFHAALERAGIQPLSLVHLAGSCRQPGRRHLRHRVMHPVQHRGHRSRVASRSRP